MQFFSFFAFFTWKCGQTHNENRIAPRQEKQNPLQVMTRLKIKQALKLTKKINTF